MSTQQDGPAYHKARQAITEVYRNTLHNVKICSDKDEKYNVVEKLDKDIVLGEVIFEQETKDIIEVKR